MPLGIAGRKGTKRDKLVVAPDVCVARLLTAGNEISTGISSTDAIRAYTGDRVALRDSADRANPRISLLYLLVLYSLLQSPRALKIPQCSVSRAPKTRAATQRRMTHGGRESACGSENR